MRVLQIASSLFSWGGIERYVYYLALGLTERGHEVSVVCPPGSPLSERLGELSVPMAQKAQFDFTTIGKWRKYLEPGKFDLVHVHFSPDFVVPARSAKVFGKQPVVMTRHLATRWNPMKSRAYASTFDRIIAVSDAVRTFLIEQCGIPAHQVVVAKAGCPALETTENQGEVARALRIADFNVGFFGRLTPEKGVETLISAAESLPEGIAVHIFGEGPLREALEAQNVRGRCTFHGFVPDVADAMAAMDAVAIPSVWTEAFPYAALEAMSLGKPILASQVGGLPEQVENGGNGILVPPRDPAALAAAIGRLASDSALCIQMGLHARHRHESEYTVEHFAERIEAVYRSVVPARNSGAR